VTLWRDVDGQSDAVETTMVNETAKAYVYRVEASAAPVYTVGIQRPVLTVTDIAVPDRELAPGDTVEVTATVANTGEVAGTTNVSLAMDGETYEAQSVAVGPRSSATATFSPAGRGGRRTHSDGGRRQQDAVRRGPGRRPPRPPRRRVRRRLRPTATRRPGPVSAA